MPNVRRRHSVLAAIALSMYGTVVTVALTGCGQAPADYYELYQRQKAITKSLEAHKATLEKNLDELQLELSQVKSELAELEIKYQQAQEDRNKSESSLKKEADSWKDLYKD